ncbi:hypothetical protein PanWU01x14_192200 [Parasponia andersonii]|uniref:Uncharacterized protein n=1 Tax=Parasponia andersonii TaxID=3476 RepID=A0A2P5C1F4_PARAD|nr:hypothetical protein PanWU01x14_192200 [Parasponia andersonii]
MDANPSNREIGAVVGPIPRSCTTWMIKWQIRSHGGTHRPTRVQNDLLKATRVARDTAWAHGLSEARAESIPDPGRVRPSPILTLTVGGQESRGSSARRPWEAAHYSRPIQGI